MKKTFLLYFAKIPVLLQFRLIQIFVNSNKNVVPCVFESADVYCNEKCFFTCLYRSPSQSHEDLESFCYSLDSLHSNINDQHPVCLIVIGDFSVKCSKWCTSDKDNTTGLELDSNTTTAGYSQMINKPINFINESSSCIEF